MLLFLVNGLWIESLLIVELRKPREEWLWLGLGFSQNNWWHTRKWGQTACVTKVDNRKASRLLSVADYMMKTKTQNFLLEI